MYFDKVFKTFQDYTAVVEAAKELWNDTKKQLQKDYGTTGRVYEEKYAAGKALYETSIAEAKQKGLAIVKEEFAKVHETIKDFITTPVPKDFIQTLEAVKTTGKSLSEAEAEVYLEKYKNNYTAYRSLARCMEEQTGKRYYVVVYDAIKNDIEELEAYSTRYFSDTANAYTRALFASEKHSPVMQLDVTLQNFITKDVSSYKTDEVA